MLIKPVVNDGKIKHITDLLVAEFPQMLVKSKGIRPPKCPENDSEVWNYSDFARDFWKGAFKKC